jgi:hypothetical protein
LNAERKTLAREERKRWMTYIHPDVLKELQKSAIDAGQHDYEKLHVILCHELGREDLLLQVPDYAPSA